MTDRTDSGDQGASAPVHIGRPRLAPDERRADRLSGIRLTADERASVDALAARARLPVAEFCRRAILRQPMPKARGGAIPSGLLTELNRIGNNLNQVAKAANAGRDLPRSAEVTLAELRRLVALMVERLEG